MVIQALESGILNLMDYLSAHVLTCLVPAFLIAGAIVVFVKKDVVLRYFGRNVPGRISYPVSSVSGALLAVCSCTILPLFAGIYRRGSGIGPASAFLYSGPAINVLAIAYTARVLGLGLGVARAIFAVILAILIGLTMSRLFRASEDGRGEADRPPMSSHGGDQGSPSPLILLVLLVTLLVYGTWGLGPFTKAMGILILATITTIYAIRTYRGTDLRGWMRESWSLARKIFPALLVGTFIVGFISFYLPPESFGDYLGADNLPSCFLGSVIGVMLYMPTLLEVPIIGTTFGYSSGFMGSGPALSLLLAGPAVSLPSMIVLHRIIGPRMTGGYILLVVFFSTLAGYLFGIVA